MITRPASEEDREAVLAPGHADRYRSVGLEVEREWRYYATGG